MAPDEEKDASAMIAGSDEDNLMIKLVQECVRQIGYYVLRALIDIRMVGSPTAKGLGLYALLCSNDTLQDFIGLVYSHYSIARLTLRKQFASRPIFQYQLNDQATYIGKFMKLGYVGPSDLLLSETDTYNSKYDPIAYKDENEMEKGIFDTYGEWPDHIRFVRMIKQATQYVHVKSPAPKSTNAGPPNETKEAKKDRLEKENLILASEHKNIGLRNLVQELKRGVLDLDTSFSSGSSLFTPTMKILQNFASVLKITGIPDALAILQGDLIRYVLTVECVQLEYCFEKLPGRTDAREELLQFCARTLRKSLDMVVVSVRKGSK